MWAPSFNAICLKTFEVVVSKNFFTFRPIKTNQPTNHTATPIYPSQALFAGGKTKWVKQNKYANKMKRQLPIAVLALPADDACIRPTLSSNVIALMFSEHKIASLSTRCGSPSLASFADKITHMSHRFIFTARRLALISGEPWNQTLRNYGMQTLHKTVIVAIV